MQIPPAKKKGAWPDKIYKSTSNNNNNSSSNNNKKKKKNHNKNNNNNNNNNNNKNMNNNKVQTQTAVPLQDILFLCLYKGVETKSAAPSLIF